MKKIILLLFALISVQSFAQNVEWVKSFGDTLSDEGICLATDNASNVYVGGTVEGLINLSGERESTFGVYDGILIKLSMEGDLIWYKSIGATDNNVYIMSIATDMENNLFITGKFRNELIVDEVSYPGYGDGKYDIFLSKMDLDGNFIWTKTFNGSKDEEPLSLKYFDGNIFMSGRFQDTLYFDENKIFGTDPVSTTTTSHPFVASFDTEGNTNWLKFIDGGAGFGRKIDVKAGKVYLIAENKDNCKLVNALNSEFDILTASIGGADIYVIKLDAETGDLEWGNRLGDVGADYGYGICVDNYQNVYAGGAFTGKLDTQISFDSQNGEGESFFGFGKFDFYLVKYDSEGNYVWAKVYGTENNEGIFNGDIVCTEKSSVYASVYFTDPLTQFESDIFEYETGWDGIENLLIKFDSDGNYVWAEKTNLSNSADLKHQTYIRDLELTRGDTLLFTGNFIGDGYFIEESQTLSSAKADTKDIFIGRFMDPDEIHGVDGIHELVLSSGIIELYPNPSTGLVNFNIDPIYGEMLECKVLDITGKEINTFETGEKAIEVYGNGIFIVRFKLEKGLVYKKLIIQ